jgi:AcrR family transcriptional regulator
LPQEKRDRIIQAAIEVFAQHGLKADVAAIVKGADIPRGSFYQYFDGIYDLFEYILNFIGEIKMGYLADVMAVAGEIPFIEFFRRIYEKGLAMAQDHPEFVAIGSHLFAVGNNEYSEFIQKGREVGINLCAALIEQDKQKGLIRQDVDSNALAGFMMTLASDIVIQQLYRAHGTKEQIMNVIDQMLDIIENGVKA